MSTVARTPEPPYWAVIFTSRRDEQPGDGYADTAEHLLRLAAAQPGFLGVEEAREELGITVSYWADEASIAAWKAEADHAAAQRRGRDRWYESFGVRVARVERAYCFDRAGRGQ